MASVLVIGSSNTDMVVKVDRFPQPGETLLGGEFFMFPGGKGANQAVAAARLGAKVTFVCRVGDDLFGKKALQGFRDEGIETRFAITDRESASGVALITVNRQGENEIVVAQGANARLSVQDIGSCAPAFAEADVVLAQLEVPLPVVEFACSECTRLNKRIILNPAPARALPDSVLSGLFLITPNETEAALLTGVSIRTGHDLPSAAHILLRKGVKNVIITLGAKGAYFRNEREELQMPAPAVTAVDTTAAGDVFNGALAVALAGGEAWKPAIRFAIQAASLSVTQMGAQASAPYLRELRGA
jgi:ribokinase